MVNAPFEETLRRMVRLVLILLWTSTHDSLQASDSARSSFVSLSLEKARAKDDLAQEDVVKNTAAIVYIGAMDTVRPRSFANVRTLSSPIM